MLYTYKYISHDIEEFQKYSDFLFLKVWLKARTPFDSEKLNRNQALKDIYESFNYLGDPQSWGYMFNFSIEAIYKEFCKISKSQKKQFKNWYKTNNKIHSIFINNGIKPIGYKDISSQFPKISELLKKFYRKLYGAYSPFLLKEFGFFDKIKKDHYKNFFELNFDGHEGICPFCGLHNIKGNDHSKLEAYDHFIPKGKYPFNSINFKNLAPMCHECNSSYKLECTPIFIKDKKSTLPIRRRAFYPYSKDKWEINFEIILPHTDIKKLKKNEIKIIATSLNRDEEVDSWMDTYGISERYKAKLLGKYSGVKWQKKLYEGLLSARRQLKNDNLTQEEWLNYLISECDEELIADFNFIKKPFYKELNRINSL